MSKPKLAIYWCASCGGCEEAVVDLAEDVLALLEAVDLAFWPCATDFKRADVEALPDQSLFATLVNGAIRTSEQEEMVRLLRRKSRLLVAYGACAHLGGIPGLANQFSREEILRYYYEEGPSTVNPDKVRPQPRCTHEGRPLTLPRLHHVVRALDQVVPVDYYIPGCPPTPRITQNALKTLLSDTPPPRGTVLAPDIALCDECPRKASKPLQLSFTGFQRPQHVAADPNLCLLAQGLVCLGPATRAGCGALCPQGNMPCSGCFGPTSRVRDQGAKMLSSLCANLAPKTEEEIEPVLDTIPDPIGTFYRYSLPHSLLRRKVNLPVTTNGD
ncbi:oxidoreductase [Limisphaera sp. VF-2]|jgi:F420-non-reducing hydrogenase small subunit|uniref:NADH-quinone oxidoreductase subunit B family protein n=1 Tax=Limisphaera sp. VF-2 TaxID=3400418 RepID=UPI00177582C5